MKERDKVKEQMKVLAANKDQDTVAEQALLWTKFKQLRNSVNNRTGQEEIRYKREKVRENKNNPSSVWGLAKKYMNWVTTGPPRQLEVEIDKRCCQSYE